jgi:hypothetical protein
VKQPYEPISVLNAFPTYASREDYERATGQPAPAWNPQRQPKFWFDPKPKKMTTGPDGTPYTIYTNVFLGGFAEDQNPVFETLMLSLAEASAANIPPTGTGQTNVPGADAPAVPCPAKPLSSTQQIVRYGAFAIPTIRNLDVPLPGDSAGGFSDADRTLLQAIAARILS